MHSIPAFSQHTWYYFNLFWLSSSEQQKKKSRWIQTNLSSSFISISSSDHQEIKIHCSEDALYTFVVCHHFLCERFFGNRSHMCVELLQIVFSIFVFIAFYLLPIDFMCIKQKRISKTRQDPKFSFSCLISTTK